MWKAILVLFMTSNTQPVSMMMGQFPETFMNKTDCEAFINSTSSDIAGTVDVFTKHANLNFTVLSHALDCIEDGSGEPV